MKRVITTKLIVWIAAVALILTGLFAMASCNRTEIQDNVTYKLNLENFDGIATYGEPVDLSNITIIATENGVSTEVPLDVSMVTSHIDPNRVGAQLLKFNYAGRIFSVPFTVMYKIQYEFQGIVLKTFHVLTSSELEEVVAPEKPGYNFVGWSEEIPDIIFENMTLSAEYELIVPELPTFNATYGDSLLDIDLPSTIAGAWRFDTDAETVGDAGKKTFPVKFIENATGEVAATDTVTVDVARKEVVFSDIVDRFIYNGEEQLPTYKTDVDVKVIFWADADKNYTDAGEYSYHFEVDDPNYTGEAKGTFVIEPAVVTVKIGSYTILASEPFPEVEYEVIGFDNFELLGLTVTKPEDVAVGVGTFTLTATTSNPSIKLEVEEGSITVNTAILEVAPPELSSTIAIYGDLIDTITFPTHPNGKWSWETTGVEVGDAGKQTHIAVFTPTDSRYEPSKVAMEITVKPRELVIEVDSSSTTVDYNGEEHKISFVVTEKDGKKRPDLEVVGNTAYTNAGSYDITLTVADPNYTATKTVILKINKIDPEVNFDQVYEVVWSNTFKLADIKLPEGYAWYTPDQEGFVAGSYSFMAIFTPEDTQNYNTLVGTFKVEIAKADASINNVKDVYEAIYNGQEFTNFIGTIEPSHDESVLEFVFEKDGEIVDVIRDAGTYTVTLTLAESDNHNSAQITTTVIIGKATNNQSLVTGVEAIYGDLVFDKIQLPEGDEGYWSILDVDETTTVGDAGINTFIAAFTCTTGNYEDREVTITVNVAKKKIDAPSIPEGFGSQVYTGELLTSGLVGKEGYTVTDEGGINVGTYTVTAALVSDNYIWSDDTSDDITLTYTITKAENAWVEAPAIGSWVYGEEGDLGSAVAMVGDLLIEYLVNGEYTTELPTAAGTYVARFTATDSNYLDLVTTCEFVIEKATVEVPTIADDKLVQVYTGSVLTSGLEGNALYTVTDEGGKNAATYTAVLSLTDKANYKWNTTGESEDVQLKYTVSKAQIVVEEFAIEGWTFGQAENTPTYKTNFFYRVSFVYATAPDGAFVKDIPTAAGTYYAKAIFEGNENLIGVESEAVEFTISKASVTIENANNGEKVYDTKEYVLPNVTASNDATLTVVITKNGVVVEEIIDAGTYTVTYSFAGDDNYLAAEKSITVTVKKATNAETVLLKQNAVYGNTISAITLPAGVEGYWSIQGATEETTVGNAGTNTFTAVFTCTTGNYEDRDVEITVTVARKQVDAPAILAAYREQVYTGATLTSGLKSAEGYVIIDGGAVNVGTHEVKAVLESDNYIWSDGTTEEKVLSYRITAAENQWTTAPTIPSWVYGKAGNSGNAEAFAGTVTIEYKLASAPDSAYSTELPTEAGAYIARFTATDSNYLDLVTTCEFVIEKATVEVPTIADDKLVQVYTGSVLNSGLVDTDKYIVTDNGGANVATYTAVISLIDKVNYKWDTTDASGDIQLSYKVEKAQIVISDLAINGWIFGTKANAPSSSTNFACKVSYVYASEIGGEYTATVPTAAGTHYVKALAQGDDNLIDAESEPVEFTIAKATVTINGANDSYSKVYDTKEFNITGVTASNGAPLTVVITKNGEVVDRIVNAGEYVVTFSLEESANYKAVSKEATVTVTAATNTEVVNTNQSAVYGNAISIITLPVGVEGSWSILEEVTTVGNAGINTFTAVFTPANENYIARTETITVAVAKATVRIPNAKNYAYDGEYHNSGLTDTLEYIVIEDLGGTDHGEYQVVLKLIDPDNYKWAGSDEATYTLAYVISAAVNDWVDEPTISGSWEYESEGDRGYASALHGEVKIEYYSADGSVSYGTTLPTLPGKYIARFTTTDTNYIILTKDEEFEITKRKIPTPVQTESTFVYTGETIFSGIGGNEFYTVEDAGKVNVESGIVVTVTLNSEYYVWADGTEGLAREYTYSITKAQIVIESLTLGGWIFGEDANTPTIKTNFDCQVSYVYADAINGDYSATVPTEAGTYYVKAIAQGNDNLIGAQSTAVEFTIGKAQGSILGAEQSYTKVYDGTDYVIEGIYASYDGAPALKYTKVQNAGTHEVVITLDESDNYLGTSITVTVIIDPAENTDEVDTEQEATYGDSVSVIVLPTSPNGTWSIQGATEETTVGNAGVNKLTAVFTPANGNYNSREVEITVTVARKQVNVPTMSAPNASQTYTGATLTSGLKSAEGYTVVDDGGINVGAYTATVTLDKANYVWSDGTDEVKSYTYSITPATNYWAEGGQPTIQSTWIYGQAGDKGSATAEFGGVKIEYLVNGAYTDVLPTNAGTYTVRFTTTDTNYTILTATRTFTIEKATVEAPTVGNVTYTGSVINSGLIDTDVYSVTDEGGTNVDAYTVTVTLKDGENYKWNTTGNSEALTLNYSIVKANINVTVTIDGWTYGEDAKTPNVTTDFDCDVTVKYSTAQNGEYTEAVPTEAGTYFVKVFAKGNQNLNDSTSDAVSFVIAKKAATIEGVKDSYTAVYNKEGYNFFADVYASNGLELDYTFTKNGENVSEILNAGEYTVVITLDASANYTGDTVTVTVSITKVQNTDAIPTYTATYGDALSTLTPPTSANGTWKWQNASDLVGNAGDQTHKLVFVPNDSENYADRTADATVAVSKKVINTPAAPADRVYTNTLYTSGLSNTELYTVVDAGGKAKGTYTATLTLTDPDNYVWDNGTATTTVSYTITKGTNELSGIVMNGWTYDGTGHAGSATAKYGDVLIEYLVDGVYTTEVPVNAGSYTARFTTTDTNCDTISTTRTFTVAKLTVSKPSIALDKQSQAYTGATLTSGIATGDRYTVVDAGGTDAGSYTVTITLKDKKNTEWNDKTTDDLTLSYTITKVSVSITLNTPSNAIYNGSAQHATYVVTPSTATVVLKYQIKNADGEWVDVDAPINAGTYRVVATVTETNNFFGATAEKTFNISKATPTWSDPSFAGGTFYQNRFDPSTGGWKAMCGNTEVAGQFAAPVITLTGENGAFVDAAENALVTVTFTPQDTVNYTSNTVSYKVTFVAVAYLDNTTPYGTIEAAVAAANAAGSGVVWVRPHDTGLGPIYINEDITIYAGVTLLLPYGTTDDKLGRNQWTGNQPFFELHGGSCSYDTHKDGGTYRAHTANEGHYPSEMDPNKCIVKVILAAGKTITNKGILEIGGELSGGGAGAQYAGFTAGKHATLVLDAGAKIISESGSKIYAAGFIRESSANNGSEVVINSGATLFQPYALKDFRDGSYMVAAKNGMKDPYYSTAYNRFVMMNVSPKLTIYYGGVMGVWASLFTGSTKANNTTSQNFIGCDTVGKDAVIVLTKSYSYLVAKYDPATEICDLKIYGGAKTQVMKLSVKMSILTVDVTTENCFFPLTYHYNITLCKSDLTDADGNLLQGADEVAIFDMGQRFKLMTGASLTIEEGARANIGTLIVYETFVDDCAYHNAHYRYPNQPAATLTVNGELVCGTFGGKIYSTGEGASVTINSAVSCTAYEITNINADNFSSSVTDWNEIPETAQLVNLDGAVTALSSAPVRYAFANGSWKVPQITFDSNGGTAADAITITPAMSAYPELPTPTKDGFEFIGWHYNGTLVKQGEALPTLSDNHLVAQWAESSNIIVVVYDNGTTTEEVKIANGKYPTVTNPTKEGYTFQYWAYNGVRVDAGDTLKSNEGHTLTAVWEVHTHTIADITTSEASVSGISKGQSVDYGTTVTFTVTFNQSTNQSVTVTDANGNTISTTNSGNTYSFTMPDSNVTISASSKKNSVCVTPDTLVTLADGTQKRIENVKPTDMLLVWNFYEGKYDVAPASILMNHGYDTVEVLTLVFADGTTIGTINGHGFFDEALNEFVILKADNVADFVGHSFVKLDGDSYSTTELVGYRVETRYTEVWSILTVRYYNCILEGLWSVTEAEVPNSPTYLMPFVVGEDMKYDSELMQADIEKYGLYTYEEFAMYCTKEQFEALGLEYFKVAVGKGYITREQIIFLLEVHCS